MIEAIPRMMTVSPNRVFGLGRTDEQDWMFSTCAFRARRLLLSVVHNTCCSHFHMKMFSHRTLSGKAVQDCIIYLLLLF